MANQADSSTLKWFLEVGGKKTGPFSAEQVQGLLQDGEIPAGTRVTTDILGGQWISVERMIETYCKAEMTGFFHPPPRPAEPVGEMTGQIQRGEREDPASSLFEVLQAARERKQAQKKIEIIGTPDASPAIPRTVLLVVVLTAMVGMLLWATGRLAKKTEEVAKTQAVKEAPRPAGTAAVAATTPQPQPTRQTPPARVGLVPAPATRVGAPPARPNAVVPPPRVRTPAPADEPRRDEYRDDRDDRDDRDRDRDQDRDRYRDDRDRDRDLDRDFRDDGSRGTEAAPPPIAPPTGTPPDHGSEPEPREESR